MTRALAILLFVGGTAAAQEIKVEGGLGSLDVQVVQRALDERAADVEACFKEHAGTLRYVGGAVILHVRVGKDGAVKSTAVQSDLGAWEVEKCLVGVARRLRLGKPTGGEAQVQLPLAFPERTSFEESDSEELDGKLRGVARCGKAREVTVTAYVGPGGRITSAGFSSEKPLPDGWGDCAIAKVRAVTVTDPRGKVVKMFARLP